MIPAAGAPYGDTFFENGYVWLPYAVAALLLLGLGGLAAVRWRRSSPRTTELLLISGMLLALLAAVMVGLADGAVEHNGLASLDPSVWQWMIDRRTPAMTSAAITVTTVGSTVAMSIIAGAAIVVLVISRRRADALLVLVVAAGAGVLIMIGKATIGRERPPVDYRLVVETNESFPSGHALASSAILGVLLVVLLPFVTGAAVRVAVLSAVVLFVLLIGLSRLYLGVHWTTDVLGGWVTGLAWLTLCLTARQVRRQWRDRPDTLVHQPGTPELTPALPATVSASGRPDRSLRTAFGQAAGVQSGLRSP